MNTKVIKITTADIPSLKSILIGGVLLDYFNNQDNNLTIIVLKSKQIFNITVSNICLKRNSVRMIYQLTYPITEICNKITNNENVIAFTIDGKELNIPIDNKNVNYEHHYDETCMFNADIINSENYTTVLPLYCLANYDKVKTDLVYGIKLECFGLFNKIISPTGQLAIVEGESLYDGTKQQLIFEYVGK